MHCIVVYVAIEVVVIHAKEIALFEEAATRVAPEAVDVEEKLSGFHD